MSLRCTYLLSATVAAAVTMLVASSVLAETLMDRAANAGLRVAFYNFKPYAYLDDSGNLIGTDVETLRIVLEKMGGSIAEAKSTDWGALIPGLKADRFDVVAAGMFVTSKRCAEVRFSEPTFGIKQAMVVAKGNPHAITNYESIAEKGLKVGVVSGSAQADYARSAGISEVNIVQLPDNPTGVAGLRAGRIDAWAVSAPGVREIIANLPDANIEATPTFAEVAGQPAVAHGAFAFRPENGEFVDAFNIAMKNFIGSVEHIALLKEHGMSADELPISTTAELCGN